MTRVTLVAVVGLAVGLAGCRLEQRPPRELGGARLEEPMVAANLRVVARLLEEGYNRRDRRLLGELLAPDATIWPAGSAAPHRALEKIEADLVALDSLAGSWHLVVDELFGSRDRVVARWHLLVAPDASETGGGGIWITRLDQGRIVEIWEATGRAATPPG